MNRTLRLVCPAMALALLFAGCAHNSRGVGRSSASSIASSASGSVSSASPTPGLTQEEILALDNTEVSYGQSVQVNEQNVPIGAVDFNARLGQYGGWAFVPDSNTIYLTFDEGYEGGLTAQLLDTLKEKGVHATFFLTGAYLRAGNDALIRRMIDEGHTLGNHGDYHRSMPTLLNRSWEEAVDELQACHDAVLQQYGYTMRHVRPPEGKYSVRSVALAQSLGYRSVVWSFAYKDWETDNQPDETEALARLLEYAHGGEILLLHPMSSTNAAILGRLIDELQTKGYVFSGLDF